MCSSTEAGLVSPVKKTIMKKVVNKAVFLLAIECAYNAAVMLPKLSILSMYLRASTIELYRRAVYVLVVILVMSFLAGDLTAVLEYQPLALFWDPAILGGHRISINAFFRWFSLPNSFTDVAMLVLPQSLVWTPNTTRDQKLALTFTFLSGSVELMASTMRFAIFFRNEATTDGFFRMWNSYHGQS